jgi:8-oxo-dGTP diphosphatase
MTVQDLRVTPAPHVILHGGVETFDLWTNLRLAQPCTIKTRESLFTICNHFVRLVAETIKKNSQLTQIVPLIVMRGGIVFSTALWRELPASPFGFIIPARGKNPRDVEILYTDAPSVSDAHYVVFDLIANTGDTLEAVVGKIYELNQMGLPRPVTVQIAAPFSTLAAASGLKERFPQIVFHTMWNGLHRRANGWLAGLDFDAGDLAFGVKKRFRNILGRCLDSPPSSEASHNMTKVAALIQEGERILVVRKSVSGRNEFIMPGGKPNNGENQEETLRRELTEELSVGIDQIKWFGFFEGQATFENVSMTMDVYEVKLQGTPKPSSEIVELGWINTRCADEQIAVGNLLKRGILPALQKLNSHECLIEPAK